MMNFFAKERRSSFQQRLNSWGDTLHMETSKNMGGVRRLWKKSKYRSQAHVSSYKCGTYAPTTDVIVLRRSYG